MSPQKPRWDVIVGLVGADRLSGNVDGLAHIKREFQGYLQGRCPSLGPTIYIDPACDRFKLREEAEQDDFRSTLATFLRLYSFVAQIIPWTSAELEMLYAFGRMLSRKLPKKGSEAEDVDLSEDVALKYYRIQKVQDGEITLEGGGTVSGPREVGTGGRKEEEEVELSRLIDLLNDRFGTEFVEEDVVRRFAEMTISDLKEDETVRAAQKANTEANFQYPAKEALEDLLLSRHGDHTKIVDKFFSDSDFGELFSEVILSRVYRELAEEREGREVSK